MKQLLRWMVAVIALSASLVTAIQVHAADVPGTQGYVNSEINRQMMNQAILRQATGGHHNSAKRRSPRHSRRHVVHHTKRHHR